MCKVHWQTGHECALSRQWNGAVFTSHPVQRYHEGMTQFVGGGSATNTCIYNDILVILTSRYCRLFSPSRSYTLGLNRLPLHLKQKKTQQHQNICYSLLWKVTDIWFLIVMHLLFVCVCLFSKGLCKWWLNTILRSPVSTFVCCVYTVFNVLDYWMLQVVQIK